MIEALKGLLEIESIADHGRDGYPYGPGPAEALDYVLKLCESMGFATKNADGKYGYAEIGQGDELIGILCHLDVVPAGNGWNYPPFAGTVDHGRLYGRGALDDKGPAVANIFAMKDLLDSGRPLNKRIRIIFGQTEENGDWYDLDAYKASEELPSYGYTPDGDFPAIYVEKGILLIKLSMDLADSGFISLEAGKVPNMVPDVCRAVTASGTYETSGKAAHGSAPWSGENALTKMMEKLEEEAPFARMYMELIGYDVFGEKLGIRCSDEESGELSLNTGMVKLEDGKLSLYLDIRHPVTISRGTILDLVSLAAAPYGASAETVHYMKPVYLDRKSPVMNCLLSAYQSVTGDQSEPLIIGGGTYARSMDNIIAFGPTLPGHENREHKEDEYILLEDLEALREIYRRAMEGLLEL
ncbi:MAG: Sapep family Mn(2+)-dependent dipeptidase [Emergencia sp.]